MDLKRVPPLVYVVPKKLDDPRVKFTMTEHLHDTLIKKKNSLLFRRYLNKQNFTSKYLRPDIFFLGIYFLGTFLPDQNPRDADHCGPIRCRSFFRSFCTVDIDRFSLRSSARFLRPVGAAPEHCRRKRKTALRRLMQIELKSALCLKEANGG